MTSLTRTNKIFKISDQFGPIGEINGYAHGCTLVKFWRTWTISSTEMDLVFGRNLVKLYQRVVWNPMLYYLEEHATHVQLLSLVSNFLLQRLANFYGVILYNFFLFSSVSLELFFSILNSFFYSKVVLVELTKWFKFR